MKSLVHARGNPYKLMLWLGILGSCLIFLFLILVLVTRSQSADWVSIQIPVAFSYSTFTILLSSFSLFLATRSFKAEQYRPAFRWHCITFCLALAFCLLQIGGWVRLKENGVFLSQVSGAFIYLLSGLHFAHIFFGIAGLLWILIDTYPHQHYLDGFIQSLNPVKLTRLQLITTFWHFIDLLWVVVFILLQWSY